MESAANKANENEAHCTQITNKYLDSTATAVICELFHNNELRVWRKILQRFADVRVVDGRAIVNVHGNGGVAVLQKHIRNVIKHHMRFAEESRDFSFCEMISNSSSDFLNNKKTVNETTKDGTPCHTIIGMTPCSSVLS